MPSKRSPFHSFSPSQLGMAGVSIPITAIFTPSRSMMVYGFTYGFPVAVSMMLAPSTGAFISLIHLSYTLWPVSTSWLPKVAASYRI